MFCGLALFTLTQSKGRCFIVRFFEGKSNLNLGTLVSFVLCLFTIMKPAAVSGTDQTVIKCQQSMRNNKMLETM